MEGRLLPTRTATMCTTRRNGVPHTSQGWRVYPSREEAEYTAALAFAIAVSVIWWAARRGLAKLTVPRMPAFTAVGRREQSTTWVGYGPHGPDLGADSSIARVYDGVTGLQASCWCHGDQGHSSRWCTICWSRQFPPPFVHHQLEVSLGFRPQLLWSRWMVGQVHHPHQDV